MAWIWVFHFTETHRSSKFYNSDDVNAIAGELRETKTKPISL